jgi:hypothetical protein
MSKPRVLSPTRIQVQPLLHPMGHNDLGSPLEIRGPSGTYGASNSRGMRSPQVYPAPGGYETNGPGGYGPYVHAFSTSGVSQKPGMMTMSMQSTGQHSKELAKSKQTSPACWCCRRCQSDGVCCCCVIVLECLCCVCCGVSDE